jgi:hypothetical protein
LALSGWPSFRNFGTPGVKGWITFRGNQQTNLFYWDRLNLAANGSALPARSRFGEGRSKVLQEDHPYGPGPIFVGILTFSRLLIATDKC